MTGDRLPNPMRRRAATERVAGWSWPPAPVLDPEQPCHPCDGTGYFTETLEGSNGRDEDVDYRCGLCDGSGVEP